MWSRFGFGPQPPRQEANEKSQLWGGQSQSPFVELDRVGQSQLPFVELDRVCPPIAVGAFTCLYHHHPQRLLVRAKQDSYQTIQKGVQ